MIEPRAARLVGAGGVLSLVQVASPCLCAGVVVDGDPSDEYCQAVDPGGLGTARVRVKGAHAMTIVQAVVRVERGQARRLHAHRGRPRLRRVPLALRRRRRRQEEGGGEETESAATRRGRGR